MKFNGAMPLGVAWGPLIATAAAALMKKPGGASGAQGPVFQQQFTPQFSPVMQQQQESPGGTQAASPIQYAAGSQTATPGIPGQPSITPYPSPLPLIERPVIQSSNMNQQYLKWGIIGLIGIMGVKAYKNNAKKGKR